MLRNIGGRLLPVGRSVRHLAMASTSTSTAKPTASMNTATTTATAKNNTWDIYAGVLVERLPVVSKTLNPLEQQFQEFLWSVELENSLKSNHEMQHERDQMQAELIKKGQLEVELEDSSSKQTAQDLKDAYVEELKKFQPASRTTPDDTKQATTTTNHCLEETLYLLVEQKLGAHAHLLLPQGPRLDGETMRQAAERILRDKCGNQLQVLFYGNAPCGFYKYKYPTELRSQSVGAKVFFYRAALQKGNVDKTLAPKFTWLPKPALNEKLKNDAYAESIQRFLI